MIDTPCESCVNIGSLSPHGRLSYHWERHRRDANPGLSEAWHLACDKLKKKKYLHLYTHLSTANAIADTPAAMYSRFRSTVPPRTT